MQTAVRASDATPCTGRARVSSLVDANRFMLDVALDVVEEEEEEDEDDDEDATVADGLTCGLTSANVARSSAWNATRTGARSGVAHDSRSASGWRCCCCSCSALESNALGRKPRNAMTTDGSASNAADGSVGCVRRFARPVNERARRTAVTARLRINVATTNAGAPSSLCGSSQLSS